MLSGRNAVLHSDPIQIHPEISPKTRGVILSHLRPFASLPARKNEASAAFKAFTIDESEIRRCGHFVPGERSRFVVAQAEAWILLAIFWDNMQSPIHDHDQSDCGFRVIAGEVEETRYALVEGDLVRPVATRLLVANETAKSTGESIHRLGVPTGQSGQSITLHLYSPILGFDAMGIYRESDDVVVNNDRVQRSMIRSTDDR